ncbi:unnamed protein product [Gordionus sp. m RMFG-2023]
MCIGGAPPPIVRPCPPGWVALPDSQTCYIFIPQPLPWQNAKAFCYSIAPNSALGIIDNAPELSLVSSLAQGAEIWVGDEISSSLYEKSCFKAAFYSNSIKLVLTSCSNLLPFVCELDISPSPCRLYPPFEPGVTFYPHLSLPYKYVECSMGRTFVRLCAKGTVYNPNLRVCDHPRKKRAAWINKKCPSKRQTYSDYRHSENPYYKSSNSDYDRYLEKPKYPSYISNYHPYISDYPRESEYKPKKNNYQSNPFYRDYASSNYQASKSKYLPISSDNSYPFPNQPAYLPERPDEIPIYQPKPYKYAPKRPIYNDRPILSYDKPIYNLPKPYPEKPNYNKIVVPNNKYQPSPFYGPSYKKEASYNYEPNFYRLQPIVDYNSVNVPLPEYFPQDPYPEPWGFTNATSLPTTNTTPPPTTYKTSPITTYRTSPITTYRTSPRTTYRTSRTTYRTFPTNTYTKYTTTPTTPTTPTAPTAPEVTTPTTSTTRWAP